jgi:hypothetical protein
MTEDNQFDDIVENSDLNGWMEERKKLTFGDIYEGMAMLSSLQVEIHDYLRHAINRIKINAESKEDIQTMPVLTQKQIASLMSIFEDTSNFLGDDVCYDE